MHNPSHEKFKITVNEIAADAAVQQVPVEDSATTSPMGQLQVIGVESPTDAAPVPVESTSIKRSPTEQPRAVEHESESPADAAVQPAPVEDTAVTASGMEQFQAQDVGTTEDSSAYPTGLKLWLTMACMCASSFLQGLDLTIVAVTVPKLTDAFKTVTDIGWYSAAYGLTMSAFIFFFGKLYTLFPTKVVFLSGMAIFEAGSLLCTLSTSSRMFIVGRAIVGLGTSAIGVGLLKILKHLFPLSKQGIMISVIAGFQSVGLVAAPMIGGTLIDLFSWRACFGINVPLGALCIVISIYSIHDPVIHEGPALSFAEKLQRVNLIDTLLAVPAITCVMMALQWGGTKYGWGNARIIALLIAFAILFSAFAYLQYRQGDNATIPPRILRNRSILAGMWFSSCCNGILAMTEYYMSIYFQGVKGYTAFKSGLLAIPMLGGISAAGIAAGLGVTAIGYYSPFMLATSILAPIASGLLTTLELGEATAKAAALVGFLGIAVGLGLQGPSLAVQAILSPQDVSIGSAVIGFGSGMGSALWIMASSTLFDNRLAAEFEKYSPATNVTSLKSAGLSGIRNYIGSAHLKAALTGYGRAVDQTLYMPLALGVTTIVGSLAMEMRSIKKKQE